MLQLSLNPALLASSDGQHMSFERSFRISIPAEQGARRLISYPCQWSYGNQLEENWDANSCNCATCFWMATWLSREPSRRKHEFSFHLISSSPFGVFLSVCVCDRIFNTAHMVSRTDINIRSRNTQTLLVDAMRLEAWVLIKTSAAQLRTGYNNPQLTITINPIVSPFIDQLVYTYLWDPFLQHDEAPARIDLYQTMLKICESKSSLDFIFGYMWMNVGH